KSQTPNPNKQLPGQTEPRSVLEFGASRKRTARSATSCVRQKICCERVTAFSLPLLLKKEERAGERRRFLSIPPLSGSLPARSSRGERGRTPQAFCVPNTTGCIPARVGPRYERRAR